MDLTFNYVGPVNDDAFFTLSNFVNANFANGIDSLTVNISSLGGSVSSGVTTYNYLKALPFNIITHNMGDVSSAAILVYLAGSTRTAENDSKFVIHPLSISVDSNKTYYQVQELLHGIEADINLYKNIVANETNDLNGNHNLENLLKSSSLVLTPAEAHDCGLITVL